MANGFIKIKYKNGLETTTSLIFVDDCIYLYPNGSMFCSICGDWVKVLSTKKELENLGVKFKNH